MPRTFIIAAAVALAGLSTSACVSTVVGAVTGVAVGVTGAAVKTTAKGAVAVGKAVIPGGGDEDENGN